MWPWPKMSWGISQHSQSRLPGSHGDGDFLWMPGCRDDTVCPNQPLSSSPSAHPKLEFHPSWRSLGLRWHSRRPQQLHIGIALPVLSTPSLRQDLEIHGPSTPVSCHVQHCWKPCKRCPTERLTETASAAIDQIPWLRFPHVGRLFPPSESTQMKTGWCFGPPETEEQNHGMEPAQF